MTLARTCKVTGAAFTVSDAEMHLLRRIGQLYPPLKGEALPVPNVHPLETLRRIFSYGGLRYLFRSTSAVSGKPLLVRYNPELKIQTCTQEEFIEQVDNTDTGCGYDFERSFFDQWRKLFARVILPPLNRTNCENSEYVNGAKNLKDCYLCFATFDSVDCLYCLNATHCESCIDLCYSEKCALCYSSCNLTRCYSACYSVDCRDCHDIIGCRGCNSCSDCIGCYGLERKQYCVFNEQFSKTSYFEFLQNRSLSSYRANQVLVEECRKFIEASGFRAKTIFNSNNSSGACLERCEDVTESRGCHSCKQCGYLILGANTQYGYVGANYNCEFVYCSNAYDAQVSAFNYTIFGGRNNFYSISLYNGCSDCFGCIGLNRKQYCILNTQYSREDYEELVPRVIAAMKARGEWGEWFPLDAAPHYYHECSVHEFLREIPLEEAARRGYRVVHKTEEETPPGSISASDLPDRLDEGALARYAGASIQCNESGRPFNLQRREVEFAAQQGFPLPRVHWRKRMQDLIGQRDLMPGV